MPAFVKRSGGHWAYVIGEGRDPETNRYRQVWRSGFATKGDARRAYEAEMAERRAGTHVEPHQLTLGQYLLERWLPAMRTTIKPATLSSYRGHVTPYLVPRLGHIRLQELTADDLQRCYADLLTDGRRQHGGGPLSTKTVANIHGCVRKALNDAVRWGLIGRNPALAAKSPSAQTAELSIWSPAQLRVFLDHVADDRFYAVWLLFCTTGMRRGEVAGLSWSNVDLDAGVISVVDTLVTVDSKAIRGTPKTRKGRRRIAVDDATVAALRTHRATQLQERLAAGPAWQDHDAVVALEDGRPAHPQRITAAFRRHADAAGLPRIRLHDLRHSYATAALGAGVPVKVVSERLGHANTAITSDLYMHVPDEMDRAAADTIAASILGPGA